MLNKRFVVAVATLVPLLVFSGWTSGVRPVPSKATACVNGPVTAFGIPDPPVYYAIDLITTRKIKGARRATGTGNLTFAGSPFGVAISKSGNYVYDISIELGNLDSEMNGQLVAWVTSTDLSDIRKVGVLDGDLRATGRVDFTKFLVVITLEPTGAVVGDMWTGPVVLRGMSRSGLMHTKAGHGPFQVENCASYGYS
jgi:hypothetical protein